MYNPYINEVAGIFEALVNKHSADLYTGGLDWEAIKDPDDYIVQVVPKYNLEFKF